MTTKKPGQTPEQMERYIEEMRACIKRLDERIGALESANGVSPEERGNQLRDQLVGLRAAHRELGQVLSSLDTSRQTGWLELSSMLQHKTQDLETAVAQAEAQRTG